jgi:hypothetical protein
LFVTKGDYSLVFKKYIDIDFYLHFLGLFLISIGGGIINESIPSIELRDAYNVGDAVGISTHLPPPALELALVIVVPPLPRLKV